MNDRKTASVRGWWTRRMGRWVRYDTTNKDWNGRVGKVVGMRGDNGPCDPNIAVLFKFRPVEGRLAEMTSPVLWHVPAHNLVLVNEPKENRP